jgi:hypothetical protein
MPMSQIGSPTGGPTQDLHTKTMEMHLQGSEELPLALQNDHYWLHYRLGVCIR